MLGRVKFYSKEKGYGFINSENNEHLFYHISDVLDFNLVNYGDVVEFEETSNKKGKKAVKIKLIEKYKEPHKEIVVSKKVINESSHKTKRAYDIPKKYEKYVDPSYSELCEADARRNLVIWSR